MLMLEKIADTELVFLTAKLFMIPQRFRFLLRVSDFNGVDNNPASLLSTLNIFHTFSVSVGDFEQVNLHSFFIRTSKIGP